MLAAIVFLVSGLALRSLSESNDRFVDYVTGINARLLLSYEVRTAVERRAIAARNLVLVTEPQDRDAEKAAVTKAHEDVQQRMAKLMKMASEPGVSDTARKLVADMEKVERAYAPVALAIVELALGGKHEEAVNKMNKECRPLLVALMQAAHEYRDYTIDRSNKLVEHAASEFAHQRNLLILGCLLAFALAGVAGFLITRSLTRALGGEPAELGAVMQRVADGDLSARIELKSGDASSVMAAAARMQGALSQVVSSVRQNSESLATASAQIAQGNQDLSGRTEEQASALQQTAATMEQLGTTVRNNADSAKQANQLAQGASVVAAEGGEVVGRVVVTMQGINDSSRKIGDIISVIDGIAFQTNILALNAAVEAARAGEQGRGFAVVASEVRSLAQRSAEAAKEIKTLIGRSVEQVEQGTVLVDQAGKTMGDIVSSIQRVSDIVAEITSASAEQSSGVHQVGEAVSQMDQATQQNAALVEESAAAAESLKAQAQQLVHAVAVFKLSQQVH
ncbi:MAG TPA: methyl-accepting chemotaxis protein [Albitalea sp.]